MTPRAATGPLRFYREIWLVDFEFGGGDGNRPEVRCMVGRELRSGKLIRMWETELRRLSRAPFATDSGALFVAYYACAEISCFLDLGWPVPERVLDLFVEFRRLTNDILPQGAKRRLLDALLYFGLPRLEVSEKEEMRQLALRGGPYTKQERIALVDYCQTDVDALAELILKMERHLDLGRALLRGRYMIAVARMEWEGVPIDTEMLARLRHHWEGIKVHLIERVDRLFGVYEGSTFKRDRFAAWLADHEIPWPLLESGVLDLKDDTFGNMARAYPEVLPLKELRHTMGALRLERLTIGRDGRNRTMLSAFRSKTGRNQPSNAKSIFGPDTWIRSLIRPASGRAVAYCDWSQQEFGIAAKLSGDQNMMEAYSSGDPYIAFARQVGAVPEDATKHSHPHERERFKTCILATQYGMGPYSLAARLRQQPAYARDILAQHERTYAQFWKWARAAIDHAMIHGQLWTVFGWTRTIRGDANTRSLSNFPVQAGGAEMLRLAACLATERGVNICMPVHDALLCEGPADSIDDVVAETQAAMLEASMVVLDGFQLRTDAEVVRWPDRYQDERGIKLWDAIQEILADFEGADTGAETCAESAHPPVPGQHTRPVIYEGSD